MENYRILERLGKGGQGSVHVVENKQTEEKCVLKKVECHDESEANKAFREALALQRLRHPYICGYKEFFVMWDKEESAMFVCIVMDLYSQGDLRKVIRQAQEAKQPIQEQAVRKYLGEILEALIFVHKKGVIHRDLKPSNIFVQDNDSVCLGDFGVATIMGDAKTNTRSTVGTTNYMAPEVQTRPYDERSDVWALGCILFELTTTAFFDSSAVAMKLAEVKADTSVLEEIFEDIAKHFSKELITVMRMMLKANPDRRPTAEQLAEKSAYVKQCLEMCDSVMVEKRKRLEESGDSPDSLFSESPGVLVVLEHIAKNIDNKACVQEGMEHLVEITKQDGVILENNSKRLVAAAMRNNISNKAIQIAGCNILNNVIVSVLTVYVKLGEGAPAQSGDILFTPEMITPVIQTMKTHPDCLELQQTGTALLMALSADNKASEFIGSLGGIEQILCAMRSYMDNTELCATSCSALWGLTINESNCQIVNDHKAIEAVCTAMKTHPTSQEVAEAASAALFSLCLDEKSFQFVNDLDTVGLLLTAVETHNKNPKVVKNACMALAGLVEPDEECAYRVLTSEGVNGEDVQPSDGIPILTRAYELHKDNAEVVESIVTLIMELAEYDEVNAELRYLGVGSSVLIPVHKRFRDNWDIIKPCETAMQKLGTARSQVDQTRQGQTTP